MKHLMFGIIGLAVAASTPGAVFERFLSPDRPADRVIMEYMALEKAGKATSMDLANMGVLILEKGFPHDAERYLRKALKADKHNYEAAYRLGLVLQREGRDREAVRYYKRTVKERPGYAEARFMLALAEERCGRRSAAVQDYVRAYRHNPDLANPDINPLVYDSKLQTEAMLGHYRETVVSSTLKVTEVDPAAVRRMMEAFAPEARPQPQARPATPAPLAPQVQPTPQAQATPQVQPTAEPQAATQERRPIRPNIAPPHGFRRGTPPPTPTPVP
jgi:tetratricopeptide (TPR) repeat protein